MEAVAPSERVCVHHRLLQAVAVPSTVATVAAVSLPLAATKAAKAQLGFVELRARQIRYQADPFRPSRDVVAETKLVPSRLGMKASAVANRSWLDARRVGVRLVRRVAVIAERRVEP